MRLGADSVSAQSDLGRFGQDRRVGVNIPITVRDVSLSVSAMIRQGPKAPILFLHGFGSSKEDFADAAAYSPLDQHRIVAYDAAGCGRTACSDLGAVDISFLVEQAKRVISHFELERFHLVGHSMGGLTALCLAETCPDAILSFTSIEGNLAPEDCFLSRQALQYSMAEPDVFLEGFADRLWHEPHLASALFAERVRFNVRPEAIGPIFRSMVALSESGTLLASLLQLPFRKMFMFGSANASLSYLQVLKNAGVTLAEIPHSGHFPMYSNPPAMWRALAHFIAPAETGAGGDGAQRH